MQKQIDQADSGQPSWTQLTDVQLAGVSELSAAEAKQLQAASRERPEFISEVQMIANSVEPTDTIARSKGLSDLQAREKTLMSPSVLADVQRERTQGTESTRGFILSPRLIKGAVLVVARTISRFASKRDHGVHATVVEEIFREFYVSAVGQELWGLMKKDTADAFQPNEAIFGGTAFLNELKALVDAGTPPRVTLVGHSAGSEYVCNLLKRAGDVLPDSFQFDVILIAPACRIELFADVIAHHAKRIRNFRCFTLRTTSKRRIGWYRCLPALAAVLHLRRARERRRQADSRDAALLHGRRRRIIRSLTRGSRR